MLWAGGWIYPCLAHVSCRNLAEMSKMTPMLFSKLSRTLLHIGNAHEMCPSLPLGEDTVNHPSRYFCSKQRGERCVCVTKQCGTVLRVAKHCANYLFAFQNKSQNLSSFQKRKRPRCSQIINLEFRVARLYLSFHKRQLFLFLYKVCCHD